MKKVKTVKMAMKQADIDGGRNTDGQEGVKCNNCGGYGYTMKLGGGRLPCLDCRESGVRELSKEELQHEVHQLKQDVFALRSALLKDLGFHSIKVPQGIRKGGHE